MLRPMSGGVALLTPFASPSVRGNAVTVERIARGLADHGVDVRVWDLSTTPEAAVAAEIEASHPALIHAFHAYRVGPLALRLARRAELPLVVTLTGTDANHDLLDADRAPVVRRVLEGAAAIVAFHESIAARVRSVLPDVGARLHVIPQASRLDEQSFDLGARWPLPSDRVLFLFAAGIRPVKRPRFALQALAPLAARHSMLRLAYAGPLLDREEGEALLRQIDRCPWARHLGVVPHAAMGSLLRAADVVLNCSVSEGGMANAVLEALTMGRAVLASDIDGNRSLVEDGVTGLLYRDVDGFQRAAERLITDSALRTRLGRAGRERVLREYPPTREIEGYLTLYRRLAGVLA
jgi:glycosyltransferase involved in cell wall biosynthesis